MSVNLRYPNISGLTEKEQLIQIKSFLHQLVADLNYALPTLGTGDGATQPASDQTYDVQGAEISYYELRSLIVNDLQQLNKKFDQLSQKVYSDVDNAVDIAIREAKENGEFEGPQGPAGPQGEAGYTPVKGVDYFTEEEVNSVVKEAAEKILFTLDDNGNLYYEVEE